MTNDSYFEDDLTREENSKYNKSIVKNRRTVIEISFFVNISKKYKIHLILSLILMIKIIQRKKKLKKKCEKTNLNPFFFII